MIDPVLLERRFTEWAARVLGLTVDRDIYRGGIPASARRGVGVLLHGELRDGSIRPATYNVQLLGKFDDRDEALRMLAGIAAVVPCYGVCESEILFTAILPRGAGEPYPAADGGTVQTYASINLQISALTINS